MFRTSLLFFHCSCKSEAPSYPNAFSKSYPSIGNQRQLNKLHLKTYFLFCFGNDNVYFNHYLVVKVPAVFNPNNSQKRCRGSNQTLPQLDLPIGESANSCLRRSTSRHRRRRYLPARGRHCGHPTARAGPVYVNLQYCHYNARSSKSIAGQPLLVDPIK